MGGFNRSKHLGNNSGFNSTRGIGLSVQASFNILSLNPTIFYDGNEEVLGLLPNYNDLGTANKDAVQGTGSLQPIVLFDAVDNINFVDFTKTTEFLDMQTNGEEFIKSSNNTGGFEIWKLMRLDDARVGIHCYMGARTATKLYFQL